MADRVAVNVAIAIVEDDKFIEQNKKTKQQARASHRVKLSFSADGRTNGRTDVQTLT